MPIEIVTVEQFTRAIFQVNDELERAVRKNMLSLVVRVEIGVIP